MVGKLLELLRYAVIILALYLCLPLLFYVFPDTQDITNTLLGWIISPAKDLLQSLLHFLPNLFTIIVVFIFTRYLVRGLRFFFHEVGRGQVTLPGFHSDFARPTFNIVRFVLYAFMLVVIFPYLPGSSSPAFQGVSVFLGLLISLGSSSAINNIIAGLVFTYIRPFKIGDRIRIGDTAGDVIRVRCALAHHARSAA
jgi:small-conductance mechanosensitive channel